MKIKKAINKFSTTIKTSPPVIFLLFIFLGLVINYYYPITISDSPLILYFGIGVIFLRQIIEHLAKHSFKKSKVKIKIWKTKTEMINRGIYRQSRNPVYLSFCCTPISAGLLLNNAWLIISVLPSILLTYYMVIIQEERHLEEKFGHYYLSYKNQVRRWL